VEPAKKVLVLTDNVELLSRVATYLEGNGYYVEVTRSAPQALHSLQTDAYDSLISDVDSDNTDGMELARIAAGLQRRIRVILVSARRIQSEFRKFPCLKTPIRVPKLMKMLKGDTSGGKGKRLTKAPPGNEASGY
jgi:CheY-like chemotaxis protein